MKIALIARGVQPGAGIERYTFELARRLSGRHDVTVITQPQEYADCGARLVPVNTVAHPKWLSILEFSRQAGLLAQKEKFDIVHTQGSDGFWGDVVTAHSSHKAGMRASLKVKPTCGNHLRKWLSPAHRSVLWRERQALTSAWAIASVTKRVARQLRAAYPGLDHKKMHVVYPGVSPVGPDQQQAVIAGQQLRQQLGLSSQHVLFVLVANDPRLKGAVRLIQGLAHCQHPGTRLLICSAKGHHPDLQQEAVRQQVANKVFFLNTSGGATAVYAAADVVTSLPDYESFGLALLEGMAWGKPLLTSTQAGLLEIIHHQPDIGLILPAQVKSAQLGAAMTIISEQQNNRVQWGRQARHLAESHGWDRMAATLEGIYQQVLALKKDRHG